MMLLLLLIASSSAFVFHEPAELASFGHIYTPHLRMLYQYIDMTKFGKNYSVQIAPDVGACQPQATPDIWQGKIVWYAEKPCDNYYGHAHLQQLRDLQALGAVAQIAMSYGFTATWTCGRNIGGTPTYPTNPWLYMTNLKDWRWPPTGPTGNNPEIPFKPFVKRALSINITGLLEVPDFNILQQQLGWQASGTTNAPAFITWTCYSMALISMIVCIVKLTQFIQYQEGIKFSLPQIVLSLAAVSSFWLFFFIAFANPMYSYTPDYISAFFQSHFAPYCYSAVTVYSFYLIEVSNLSSNQGIMPTLSYLKWPALAAIVTLFVAEIVCAVCFVIFDIRLQYADVFLLQGVIYVLIPCLIAILVLFSTVSLVLAMGDFTSERSLRALVTGILLFVFICITLTYGIINIESSRTWESPALAWYGCLWFGIWAINLTLGIVFRVQLQKEIEVSKSATSSTSSGMSSSSGSSSSSSSSNADPVIEL